jgi:succinate dehydrogenase/fumarate reductase flavoprotein subunit
MNKETVELEGYLIDVYSLNTVIVGSGAAGFNAADSLYSLGQKDIAIITEGINMGTSRNTGSDKQTYYKLTLSGGAQDSVLDMTKTLFNGGAMHGDIALVEAALSSRCFYKLANIGVPFPHNQYGEYVGYKTDHDPRQRATSCGPLTSKLMTEKLEEQIRMKNIKIFDGFLVIGILTVNNEHGKRAAGLLTIDISRINSNNKGITLFNCTNIVYATGGPAGMYKTSVYPESQTGASGTAFEAGAKGVNLTESQYGLASVKFRWNLSGTYQQVIPRYVSTDENGKDEREFLQQYFDKPGSMLDAIFLKGYQWPFDPRKIENFGSSLIDILVYNETVVKGRRVFLDYMKNPSLRGCGEELDFALLGEEAYKYLENSGALFGTPIARLEKMNKPAIELYKNNGIDLYTEYLEIAVCAQHNNGGLSGNIWWQSNIEGLFPVGEVNGTFGVYRPGGTALNSSQVGSLRAAQYISNCCKESPLAVEDYISLCEDQVKSKLSFIENLTKAEEKGEGLTEIREKAQRRMSLCGAHIRTLEECKRSLEETKKDITILEQEAAINDINRLPEAFRVRDVLITQFVYFSSIIEYIEKGGGSRGSYLISDREGQLPIAKLSEQFRFKLDKGNLSKAVCEVELKSDKTGYYCEFSWKETRSIPEEENWFEKVWKDYRENKIICREELK